jgi:hypothetical protein
MYIEVLMHGQPPVLARRHKMQAGAWLRAQREVSTPEWTKAGVPDAKKKGSSVFNTRQRGLCEAEPHGVRGA